MNSEQLSSDVARTEQQKLLGQAKLRLQDYDGAIAAFTNAIEFPLVEPTTALTNRCFAYLKIGLLLDAELDCSEARRALDTQILTGGRTALDTVLREFRSVALAQVEAELYKQVGQTLRAKEILLNAESTLKQSARDENRPPEFRLKPDQYWGVFLKLSQFHVALGDWDAASQQLDYVLEIIPAAEHHRFLDVRAQILRGQGRARDAAFVWEKAHDAVVLTSTADAAGRELRNNYLYHGCATLIQSREYDAALPVCEKLTQVDSKNGEYAEAYAFAALQSLGVLRSSNMVRRASELKRDAFILDVARRKVVSNGVEVFHSEVDELNIPRRVQDLRAWIGGSDE